MRQVALGSADYRRMLAFIEEGGTLARLEDFPGFITAALPRVVACDSISFNEVDPARGRVVSRLVPDTGRFDGDQTVLVELMDQHPLIAYYRRTGDGRAIKISDFLTDAEFRALDIYKRLYSRLATRYQMSVTLPAPAPLIIGIALNRARRDFGEKERLVMNLLRPHLEELHHRLQAGDRLSTTLNAIRQAMDAAGRGVLTLDPSGAIDVVNQQAVELLKAATGDTARYGGRPPRALRGWLSAQKRGLAGGIDGSAPAEPLVIERAGLRLVCRFLPRVRPDDHDVILLEESRARNAGEGLAPYGLTSREVEVLSLVATGRTNGEIATAMVISERTVQKHLEHIFKKLRVSSRTAAAALMLGAMR